MRELQEEAGVKVLGRPRLVGVHANHRVFRGDHVVFYRVDHWAPCAPSNQGEIHAIAWFAPNTQAIMGYDHQNRSVGEALAGWQRRPVFLYVSAAVLAFGILGIQQHSEFIYFRF